MKRAQQLQHFEIENKILLKENFKKNLLLFKIKQKISGQFNSTNSAFRFSVLWSITDTALKNKLNILKSLGFIANF